MLVATAGQSCARPARRRAGRPAAATRRLLLLAALCGGAAGCSGAPRIAIGGQEARLSPLVMGTCSIFMKIENAGDGDDSLVGAAVDIPGAVAELHGVSDGRMVKTDRVRVPARGAVELKPGGLHVMVFRLPRDAAVGYQFNVRLAFEKAGEKVASVRIAG